MRFVMLAAAATLLPLVAVAQTSGSSGPSAAPSSQLAPEASGSGDTVGAPGSTQLDPNNCGTPDEPKPCPPMPRRALRHYPANKED